jgi:hypothetical protein
MIKAFGLWAAGMLVPVILPDNLFGPGLCLSLALFIAAFMQAKYGEI